MVMKLIDPADDDGHDCEAEGCAKVPGAWERAKRPAGLVVWLLAAAVVAGVCWRVFAVVGGLR